MFNQKRLIMLKKILSIAIIILYSQITFAQEVNLEWHVYPYIPEDYETGRLKGLVVDKEVGTIYAVGYVSYTTDSKQIMELYDAVFTKYTPCGDQIFREIDEFSEHKDISNSVSLSPDKASVLIAGHISESPPENFPGVYHTVGASGKRDTADAEIIDTHLMDSETYYNSEYNWSIVDGEYLYTTYSGTFIDTDQILGGVIKYSDVGVEEWRTEKENIKPQSIFAHGDYIYIAGLQKDDENNFEAFISKKNAESGVEEWFKTSLDLDISTDFPNMGNDVVVDSENKIYFTVDYVREEDEDIYAKLIKIDSDGTLLEKKEIDSGEGTIARLGRMSITPLDEIYIAAMYDGQPVFYKFHNMEKQYRYNISEDEGVEPVDPEHDYPSDIFINDKTITVVGSMNDHKMWLAQYNEKENYEVTFGVLDGEGTITAKADGESISTGDIVTEGVEVIFTADPADGYEIKDWIVNNASQGITEDTYTIESLDFDVSVKVEFEESVLAGEMTDPEISVFPNPARDKLYIEGNEKIKQIMLFNISGQVIKDIDAEGFSCEINLSYIRTGLYLVKIHTTKGVHTKKVQIAR